MDRFPSLLALLLVFSVSLHILVGEREGHRHAFSRDPAPRPASPWRLRAGSGARGEPDATLELVCARDSKSLYCADFGAARCVADETVPLFRRAWRRVGVGEGAASLTTTDETGVAYRLAAGARGDVVCERAGPGPGPGPAQAQGAEGALSPAATWRFAKAGDRSGLVVTAAGGRRRFVVVGDVEESRGHAWLADRRALPFVARRVDAAQVEASVEAHVAAVAQAALDDAEARRELRRRFGADGHRETRVISMALYGSDDKYCRGAVRNSELVGAYFPTWTLRVYADADTVPIAVLDALRANGADVRAEPFGGASAAAEGMFRRFYVADDPTVDRFIVRDSDSRLNARDAFAVADWCDAKGWPVHSRAGKG